MTYNFLSMPNWFKPREFKEFPGGGGGATHVLASTTMMSDQAQCLNEGGVLTYSLQPQ